MERSRKRKCLGFGASVQLDCKPETTIKTCQAKRTILEPHGAMESSSLQCEEMANTPSSGVRQRLAAFLANMACDLFDEFQGPNTVPDETRVRDELFTPLQWLLCGGEPTTSLRDLEEKQSPSSICGKVFHDGELAFSCKECETSPTCRLCKECFENSEHKNHHYRFVTDAGGGCCDCGDDEAWTSSYQCSLHKCDEQEGPEVDAMDTLTSDLANRSRPFFSTLLWYCMDMLCWENSHSLPDLFMQGKTSESLTMPTFVLFLYNDEVHPYDEVISTLVRSYLNITHIEAVTLNNFIGKKGRGVVKCGSEEECLKNKSLINVMHSLLHTVTYMENTLPLQRDLESEVPLNLKVFHSAVAAHQTNAISCLLLLRGLAETLNVFRQLISEALVEVSNSAGCCILDRFFLNNSKMWITARLEWYRLVMSSIFMDPERKPQLAINLTKNYLEPLKNFVEDSHHHSVSARSMTASFFSVPSLSCMLVKNHSLLQKIIGTIIHLVSPCQDPATGILKLTPSNYKHSRICYIMDDLKYVLKNKPDDLSDMKETVLEAFQLFLDLLGMIQNADLVKRQQGSHVGQQDPWQSTFDFLVVLQQPFLLFIDWCTSDQVLLHTAVRLTIKKLKEVASKARLQYQKHEVSQELVGENKMEVYAYDSQKEHVSVHQPLSRVLAGLLTGASAHEVSLSSLLQVSEKDIQIPLFLMECSSRVIVMAVQVLAGMWKRNGSEVLHQVVTYQFKYPREIMYDKDIVMLQAMAAILDPSLFLCALIYKFRLDTWLCRSDRDPLSQRGESPKNALRFFLSEAEEFMFLLIAIFCERLVQGIGEEVTPRDTLRREIVHKLFISPQPHSQILKELENIMHENESLIDKLLEEVATVRKGHSSNTAELVLKERYEMEYCPFYYHYSRNDHSMAEDAKRKKMKAEGRATPKAASPKDLPLFCSPFKGIMRLTTCPIMHRIFHCVFTHAADSESQCWSDRLLHETLYLFAVMLKEREPMYSKSLCNAAIIGDHQFLGALNTLLFSKRAEEHKPLLTWVIEFITHYSGESTGRHSPPIEVVAEAESDQLEEKQTRWKQLSRRQGVMAHMQNVQKRYKKYMREVEGEDDVDTGTAQPVVTIKPVHVIGVSSLISKTADSKQVTCILCQAETKVFASQTEVLVQAVHVQQSCVLKRGEGSLQIDKDFLTAHARLALGTCTSGCGHYMHADCWKRFMENKQKEHSRPRFLSLSDQPVQWAAGEFLCPLCQCFSNTVIPLIPSLSSTLPSQTPLHDIGYSEWREIVRLAMEIAEGEADPLQYTSKFPTLWDKLQEFFGEFRKPSTYYQKSEKNVDRVVGMFTQSTYTKAYKTVPDEANERVCVAAWNNCAYTISSLYLSAKYSGKSLFTSLSTHQLDYLSSLARIGCDPKLRPPLKQLCGHIRKLINPFLLQNASTEEILSLVEIDTFFMMVYLFYAVMSLLTTLVSPTGCLDDSPILPALAGITMEQVVRTAAAAHLVQYLLCYPPGKDTESDGSTQVDENKDAAALQKLWLKFKHLSGLPSDAPPDPLNLLSDIRDYFEPFLQCAVVSCQNFIGINYIQADDKSPQFLDMCKCLNLPAELHTLFEESSQSCQYSIMDLARVWCEHNRLHEMVGEAPILLQPRSLITLPPTFSELLGKASQFKCSNTAAEGDINQEAMLCLLCGKMLCASSYCCMFEVEDGGQPGKNALRVGGFTDHSQSCSGGIGIGLWVHKAYVVLLDATDLRHVMGCTLTPPYLDKYGEPDPGLRRGDPLFLHEESMQDLRLMWFQHRVPHKIIQETESNPRLMRMTWSRL